MDALMNVLLSPQAICILGVVVIVAMVWAIADMSSKTEERNKY